MSSSGNNKNSGFFDMKKMPCNQISLNAPFPPRSSKNAVSSHRVNEGNDSSQQPVTATENDSSSDDDDSEEYQPTRMESVSPKKDDNATQMKTSPNKRAWIPQAIRKVDHLSTNLWRTMMTGQQNHCQNANPACSPRR